MIKAIDITKLEKQQQADAVNEVKLLSSLKHPYIVRYHESFLENGVLSIVMDFAEGGDLAQRISCSREKRETFAEAQIARWFTQVALGLKHLHARHIVHRDLKPQNLFLTQHDDLRIGDFGISKTIQFGALKEKITIGTPYYLSPEICHERLYSSASDIWALGCILYELAALRVPFEALNVASLVEKITAGTVPTLPQAYSSDLRLLCCKLLSRDSNERPSAAEIIRNPMMQAEMRHMLRDIPPTPPTSAGAGPLVRPTQSCFEEKRSTSAPVRSPAGRDKRDTFRRTGSSTLILNNGVTQAPWPEKLKSPAFGCMNPKSTMGGHCARAANAHMVDASRCATGRGPLRLSRRRSGLHAWHDFH